MNGTVTETERVITSTDVLPMEVRMKLAANAREKAIASGKTPKDIEWESFIKTGFVQNDLAMAKQHLTNYIGYCLAETNDIDKICYELFLDFTQGRNGVRKSAEFAEYVISRASNTRNVDLLQKFAKYYENLNNTQKAEALYYTLYDIYSNGVGVPVDNNKALIYLKEAIKGSNTDERRSLLRNMYEKIYSNETANKRRCIAYEKVIEDDIPGSNKDYAIYLMEQDKKKEAVPYFVADEDYESAYHAVNIRNKAAIDSAVKAFDGADEVRGIKKSLKLMQSRYSDLKTILSCTMPASGFGMLWRYLLVGTFYVPYHTFRLSPIAFILAIIVLMAVPSVLVFAMGQPQEVATVAVIACMLIWCITLIGVDLWRKYRFSQAKDLWDKLVPHPQLEPRRELFDDEVISQNKAALKRKIITTFVVVIIAVIGGLYGANRLMDGNLFGGVMSKDKVDDPIIAEQESKNDELEDKKELENKKKEDLIFQVRYKSFTDKTYGFYFEYPDTLEDIKQENTKNGTKEVRYNVKISNNASVEVAMEFISEYKGKVKGNNIRDISEYLINNEKKWRTEKKLKPNIEKIDDTSYIVTWEQADNRAIKHIKKQCFVYKGDAVQGRYISLSYGPNDLEDKDKQIWEHMLKTFKPGQI